jgi:uncharacterized membrane protein
MLLIKGNVRHKICDIYNFLSSQISFAYVQQFLKYNHQCDSSFQTRTCEAIYIAAAATEMGDRPGTMSSSTAFRAICVAARWAMVWSPVSKWKTVLSPQFGPCES